MNISSCIAQVSHPGGEFSLTWFRHQLNLTLCSKELCNLLLYGHFKCTIITDRIIIELTLEHIKGTGRFKKK